MLVYNLSFRNNKEGEGGNQSWMGYFGKALMTPANYLPSQMTEVFTQGRAFAVAKLPSAGELILYICITSLCVSKDIYKISF